MRVGFDAMDLSRGNHNTCGDIILQRLLGSRVKILAQTKGAPQPVVLKTHAHVIGDELAIV